MKSEHICHNYMIRNETIGMKQGLLKTIGLCKETFSGNSLPVFFILMIVALTVTPKLYEAIYMIPLWIVFFFFSNKSFGKTSHEIKKLLLLGGLFVTICIAYSLLGVSSASLTYCMVKPFVFYAPVLALVVIHECNNESKIRFLFHFISLIIAVNVADSIRLVNEFGLENMIYQRLAEAVEGESEGALNLGGTLFVNMIVFYGSVMFFAFLRSKQIVEKLLFFFYFGITVFFIVFLSLKASAVIILLASVALMYVACKSNNNFGKIVFISLLVFGIIFIFRDRLINAMISIIDSDRITARFEIFTSSGDVEDSSTMMSRGHLWLVSVNSWLQDPFTFLFGIGDHNWMELGSEEKSGIGNHSDVLDVLARYGLLGASVFYSSIIVYYKYLKRMYGGLYKWEIVSFMFPIVMMGLTKRFISGEAGIIFFILFPLSLKYFSMKSTFIRG